MCPIALADLTHCTCRGMSKIPLSSRNSIVMHSTIAFLPGWFLSCLREPFCVSSSQKVNHLCFDEWQILLHKHRTQQLSAVKGVRSDIFCRAGRACWRFISPGEGDARTLGRTAPSLPSVSSRSDKDNLSGCRSKLMSVTETSLSD